MDEGILLWAIFNPSVKGSGFTAVGVPDEQGRFTLQITGQRAAGRVRGTYADESALTEDGLLRAGRHWLDIFSDEGWIAADALDATSGAKNRV